MEIEPRNEVTGAEPEAGRERTRVALTIDDRHVRRVTGEVGRRAEDVEQGEDAFRAVEATEVRQPPHGLGDPRQTAPRSDTPTGIADLDGIGPVRFVRVEVRRGEKAVSLRGKREQLGC